MIFTDNNFPKITDKVSQMTNIWDDVSKMNFIFRLSGLEDYIFGANMQFLRIESELKKILSRDYQSHSIPLQLKLDCHFYILTIDKIKKIFKLINKDIVEMNKSRNEFTEEYRLLKKKIEANLKQFNILVRNEYEHPSCKPHISGNFIMSGITMIHSDTALTIHIGGQTYCRIDKKDLERLNSHWIEFSRLLLDNLIKY